MKKFIAILLILVIGLFAFTACNKDEPDSQQDMYGDYEPVEEFDGEKLKETWTAGEITFANKNKIKLPCTVKEIMDASGLKIGNEQTYSSKQYRPGEALNISLIGVDTEIKISCKNLNKTNCGYLDTTVVGFDYFNSGSGNRAITVAAGLTVGVTRAEVEEALGIPEGKTSEDRMYTYTYETENDEKISMSVSFSSSDTVNAIVYKLDK